MNKGIVSPATIFITGISASGKSTLGKHLRDDLVKEGIDNVRLLDGEDLRKQLLEQGKNYGYSNEERIQAALEFARIALKYNQQGFVCILCSICHLKETRHQMRAIIGKVMEVYLDCSVAVCAERDYKGNYAKAFQGRYASFIGVTKPYQESDRVELRIATANASIKECSKKLLDAARSFLGGDRPKIVYSYYVLDIVHRGHLLFMKNAKAIAGAKGKLIVGILTDQCVIEKKGKRPVISFEERFELAQAIKYADLVVTQETYSPLPNVMKIKPDVLMESSSHDPKDIEECRQYMESINGKVIVVPYYSDQCSTKIKNKIRSLR